MRRPQQESRHLPLLARPLQQLEVLDYLPLLNHLVSRHLELPAVDRHRRRRRLTRYPRLQDLPYLLGLQSRLQLLRLPRLRHHRLVELLQNPTQPTIRSYFMRMITEPTTVTCISWVATR